MQRIFQFLADLPDIHINANEWTNGLTSVLGPWIAGGLGLAAALLAILIGWNLLQRSTEQESEEDFGDEEPGTPTPYSIDDDRNEVSEKSED
jgi:hypothetical protein